MGACNGVSALCAIFIMSNFGRRPILIFGEAAMAICTFFSGLGVYSVSGMLGFVMLNIYICAFHLS